MKSRQVSFADALSQLPSPGGKPFGEVLKHGSLVVEIFSPRVEDTQKPHSRDEIYVVIRGHGDFVNVDRRLKFGPGDVLFAAPRVGSGTPRRHLAGPGSELQRHRT